MDAVGVAYEINTDEEKAQAYSDKFWPLMLDEEGNLYEFPEIIAYLDRIKAEHPVKEISQIRISHYRIER